VITTLGTHTALRTDVLYADDFGYKHLLWVYSGRRGIHCWISDEAAMALTDDERKTVMAYLEVVKGGQGMAKKVNVRGTFAGKAHPLHPSLQMSLNEVKSFFHSVVLEDQKCFDSREGWEALLELIPDKGELFEI